MKKILVSTLLVAAATVSAYAMNFPGVNGSNVKPPIAVIPPIGDFE